MEWPLPGAPYYLEQDFPRAALGSFLLSFSFSLSSSTGVRPESCHTDSCSLVPMFLTDLSPNKCLACLISFSICFLKNLDSPTHIWKSAYCFGIQAHEFSRFEYTHVRSTQIKRKTLPVPESPLCSITVCAHTR